MKIEGQRLTIELNETDLSLVVNGPAGTWRTPFPGTRMRTAALDMPWMPITGTLIPTLIRPPWRSVY